MTLSRELGEVLRRASTATITAQLQKRGIRNSFFSGLRPIRPGQTMVGVARTLRFGPMREDLVASLQAGVNAQRRAIEGLGLGDVLLIDARNEPDAGTIGDVLAMRAQILGAAGVVTDGGVRDEAALRAISLPMYHRSGHGATFSRRHLPLDVDLPIACAGVLVMVGDVIVGDDSGAVLIPAGLVAEVARDAAEQELKDAWAFERVRAGDGLVGTFPLGETRMPEFEAWKNSRPQV